MPRIEVNVDHGYFVIYDFENDRLPVIVNPDRLAEVHNDGRAIIIYPGTYYGLLDVEYQIGSEPRDNTPDDFDEVVVLSLDSPPRQFFATDPSGETMASENLVPAPGPLFLRVAARGRNAARTAGGSYLSFKEEIWLDIWPQSSSDG